MKRKWMIVIGVVLALSVAGLAVAAAHPWGPGGAGGENSLLSIAAETLGVEVDALVTELEAGKTLAQLAEENDVAVTALVDALIAPRAEALTAAVEAGDLTQAQADARLNLWTVDLTERLAQPFEAPAFGMGRGFGPGGMMGRGFGPDGMMGRGFGPGGMMGRGFGFGPGGQAAPEATPAGSSG